MTDQPPYVDLFMTAKGVLLSRSSPAVQATADIYWCNLRPAEITLSIRTGESHEVWSVGRSLFCAASQDYFRGAWFGGGQFAVCYTNNRAMMSFRPPGDHAVFTTAPVPLIEFVNDTERHVRAGSDLESQITQRELDRELARILGDEE